MVYKEGSSYSPADAYSNYFFQLSLNDTVTKQMSIAPDVGNISAWSIYSTANNQALAMTFTEVGSDPQYDSIIGMEFHIMAKSSAKTNFIAFLGKEGGSIRNSAYYAGMGFDKSDSVKIVWTSDAVAHQEQKNIAPIAFNKWYKCTIEHDVTTYTATYLLDCAVVGTHIMPSGSTYGYNMFVVYRNGEGQDGPAPYYLSDLTLYKKQRKI